MRLVSPFNAIRIHQFENIHQQTFNSDRKVRVGSYNIAHGRGLSETNWTGESKPQRIARLHEIADHLKQLDLDIVVLNEVDFDSTWSGGIDQSKVIAERAGYKYLARQRNLDFAFPFFSWQFGNAILSRYPINKLELVDLPPFKKWESILVGHKKGLIATIALSDEQTIRVMGLHLESRGEPIRIQSIPTVVEMANQDGLPLIVAGDLNSTLPDYPWHATDAKGMTALAYLLKQSNLNRYPEMAPSSKWLTFSADQPRNVIDWILISPHWQFEDYKVIDSQLSDHRPVVTELLLQE